LIYGFNRKVCVLYAPNSDPDFYINRQVILLEARTKNSVFKSFGHNGIFASMEKAIFTGLAHLNKWFLPSLSKKGLDLSKASKWQMALIGWRYYVTSRALG
jgi:hypothetical protein